MYEAHFKFSESPFRLSPDPAFYFGSKGHNRALAYLRYGLTQKEGFIVVTGPPGTGKTTIARALLQEVERDKIIVAELNTTHLQADDVLRMAAASFGLEHEGLAKSTLLKRMEGFFQSKFRSGYHCLLMIDEAQNLPNESLEELRMLSNFYLGKHALLQIFLLGQQQFREILYSDRMEQLRQRVVAATHLEPLSAIDTRDYIRHRLHLVGWDETNPSISKRAFAHIYALTKGIPRRINTFCDRLLLFCSLEDIREIDDAIVQSVARELAFETSARDMNAPAAKRMRRENDPVQEAKVEQDESISELEKELEKADLHAESSSKTRPEVDQTSPTVPVNNEPESQADVASLAVDVGMDLRELPITGTPATTDELFELLMMVRTYAESSDSTKDIEHALPEDMVTLFRFALGQAEVSSAEISKRMAGTNFDELKEATRIFIKEVMLNSGTDYYRRLGLRSDADSVQVKEHYRYLFKLFQPDQELDSSLWDESYTRRINQAYSTLRDEGKRKAYDSFLQALQSRKSAKSELSPSPAEDVVSNASPIEDDEQVLPSFVAGSHRSRRGWGVVSLVVAFIVVLLLFAGVWGYFSKPEVLQQIGLVFSENEREVSEMVESDAPAFIPESVAKIEEVIAEPPVMSSPVEKVEVSKAPALESVPEPEVVAPAVVEIKTLSEEKAETEIPKTPEVLASEVKSERKVKKKPQEPVVKLDPGPDNTDEDALPLVAEKPEVTVKPVVSIKETELKALVGDFSGYYEEANLKAFMALFSNRAVTNDRSSKKFIQQDYKDLFEGTDMRAISFENMKWTIADSTASGKGEFVVTVLQKGGKKVQKISGVMELEVVKERGKLLLTKVFHSYLDN